MGISEFQDRREAGQILALKLQADLLDRPDLVLALPRGGVPVGFEVAAALHVPLDVFIVRKLGVPFQPELAMGAIASGGACVMNEEVFRGLDLPSDVLDRIIAAETAELHRREAEYRGQRPPLNLQGRSLLVVDDGLATGASMRAAVVALRSLAAQRIVVAVPVAPPEVVKTLAREADAVHAVLTPPYFAAVGQFYRDFSQTTDQEVKELLAENG